MKRYLCITLLHLGLWTTACGSGDPAGSGGGTGNGGGITAVPEGELAELLAVARCDLLFSCECASSFSSKETCVNQVRALLQQEQQSAKDRHLDYDAACAGSLIHELTERGCAPLTVCKTEVCWPYYGTTTFGGGCELPTSSVATTCAQGSTCSNHDSSGFTCGEPCTQEQAPEGAPCTDFEGQVNKTCAVGLACALEKGGVCAPRPKAGEPCLDMHVCADEAYCETDNPVDPHCVARQPNGAACAQDLECQSLLCKAGKCADLPAICTPFDIPR